MASRVSSASLARRSSRSCLRWASRSSTCRWTLARWLTRCSLQLSSSGQLSPVAFRWSSTVVSLPCFHSS
ncbi:hypothetical protein EYF80_059556 [Liparis tanakae]|uniref:Uncharacterized protein n=1 Tax=Liparis tanakae TaxID=230148 RepID=A0A4Z2EPG6_9TELE|nr:hypothetical protein EYF80_059556 [Liparis tanakae]